MRPLIFIFLTALMLSACGGGEKAETPPPESENGDQVTVTDMSNGQAAVNLPPKTIEITATLPTDPESSPDKTRMEEAQRRAEAKQRRQAEARRLAELMAAQEDTANENKEGAIGIGDSDTDGFGRGGLGMSGAGQGGGGTGGGLGGLGTTGYGSKGSGAGAGSKAPPTSAQLKQRKMRQMLRDLNSYPIAYETPNIAVQNTAFDVTLAIDASGDVSAVEGLPQKQNITEAVAQLSELVEAKLSGATFEIKASNARTQLLLPHRETVWRWSVEPLQAGDHELYLEIFANIGLDDMIMLESYSDLITVDVAPNANKPRLIDDMRVYISVIGGIVSLILGLIALSAHLRNRRERENDAPDS